MTKEFKENGFIVEDLLNSTEVDDLLNAMLYPIKSYFDYYGLTYIIDENKTEMLYTMLKKLYEIDPQIYFEFVRQNGAISDVYKIKTLIGNQKVLKILEKLGYKEPSIPVTTQLNFYL